MVTTVAADDHEGFRGALRDLIEAAPGFVLVGEVSSGEEAMRVVDKLSPRLVLMDILMPGMGGIAAAQEILRRHPEVVVVLMSVEDPALDAAASALGETVGCARKQELRPQRLRNLWETTAPDALRAAASSPARHTG